MRTKFSKYLMLGLAALMAAVTFTACSDDDDNSIAQSVAASNEVKFNASVLNAAGTRATPITSENYSKLMKDFYVTAGYMNPTNGKSSWFFTNELFTGDGNGVYSSAAPYYWGDTDLEFAAVSPASSDITITNNAAGVASFTYTVPYDQSKQVDLMAAYGKGNKNSDGGKVSLTFKHVLSQVRFAATSASNISAKIKSIKIHNVFNIASAQMAKGSLKVSSAGTSAQVNSYAIGLTTPKAIDGAAKINLYDDNGVLLLVPQKRNAASFAGKGISYDKEITAGYVYLEIECNIKDKAHDKYIVGNANSYSKIYVPVAVDWEPGKCYTYIINFTGGDGLGYDEDGNPIARVIKTDVKVENWQNAADITKTI